MYDIFIYASLADYLHKYKHHLKNKERHAIIDGIYIANSNPKRLIIATEKINRNTLRPRFDTQISIVDSPTLPVYYNNSDLEIVPSSQAHILKKESSIGFIKYRKFLFFTRYKFKVHFHRFFGIRSNLNTVNFNWFFDRQSKIINFVMTDQNPHQ